jgi:hypothetical protein
MKRFLYSSVFIMYMGWLSNLLGSSREKDKKEIKLRVKRRNPVLKMIDFLENKGYTDRKRIKALLLDAIIEQFDEEIAIVEARLGELVEIEKDLEGVDAVDLTDRETLEQRINDVRISIDSIKRKKKTMLSQLDTFIS